MQNNISTGVKSFIKRGDDEGHQSESLIVIQLPGVIIVEELPRSPDHLIHCSSTRRLIFASQAVNPLSGSEQPRSREGDV